MAVTGPHVKQYSYIGLSTDTKPTSSVPGGSLFYESDTGDTYEYSGTAWHIKYAERFKLDHTVDIEISGESTINRRYNHTSGAGETVTVLAVVAGYHVKLYKALLSVSADVTGEFQLLVGAKTLGGIYNPKSGGLYMLLSPAPDYELGADGEDITLIVPAAATFSLDYSYNLEVS